MDGQKVLQYALNLADLMRKASLLLGETAQQHEHLVAPTRGGKGHDDDRIDPSSLQAIGLDDTSIMSIIIELSQDRTNFKIWTPYDESFNSDLKRHVPKGARKFDWDEKCWRVDVEWFGNVQHLILEHYPNIDRKYTNRAVRMLEAIIDQQQEEEEQARYAEYAKHQSKHEARARAAYDRYRDTARRAQASANDEYDRARRRTEQSYDKTWDDWDEAPDGDDPYKVLGVQPDAPDEVIKAAHKAQARKHHTDVGGDGVMMAKINAAYESIGRQRGWKG
jgi:hypothetical protein